MLPEAGTCMGSHKLSRSGLLRDWIMCLYRVSMLQKGVETLLPRQPSSGNPAALCNVVGSLVMH